MIISNKSNITYDEVMPDGETSHVNAESNTVNTEILSDAISKVIRSDKTYVREGETVRNTVTVTNNSTTKLFDNFFTIPKPFGESYVAGNVKINGIAQPNYDPVTGFFLPDLNPGESVTIEYDLKVNSPCTSKSLTDSATLNYKVNDPARGNVSYSENTDSLSIAVVSDKISVVKSVDKSFAVKGELLHYTITITNTGNIAKTAAVFRDPIPVGTTFVSNSIKINGTGYSVYDPEIGFALRSLAPGEVLTVEFDVKVN